MGPARQPTARSITMSLRARGTSWSSVTRSPRMGPDGSRIRPSSASWALCVYASSLCDACRGSWMKPVGEPDAGNPHVRFDERGGETGRCRMAQVTAPFLDSTAVRAVPCRLAHPTSSYWSGVAQASPLEMLHHLGAQLGLLLRRPFAEPFARFEAELALRHKPLEI